MTSRRRRIGSATLAVGVVLALTAVSSAQAATPGDTDTAEPAVRVHAAAADDLADAASARVAAMSVREQAASVVMGHVPTSDPAALNAYMAATGIGGFILMGANVPASEAELRAVTTALTLDAALPPLIGIDQEGGDVSRLPWDDFAGATTLKNEDPAATRSAFAGRGALLQRAGIGVNFGIVADVTSDPSMFIYGRALGTTPDASAARVAAAVEGESVEAMSTLKHFPGHGAAPGDSHSSLPAAGLSLQEWATTQAPSFQAGIEAGAPLLMFGHLVYPAIDPAPATMSAEWHRIARGQLGFTGVAITDDLGMLQASGDAAYADPVANAVGALAVGNDMVLSVVYTNAQSAPTIVDGIVAAVEAGTLPAERLQEAAERITALRLELAAEGRGLTPCRDCAPADG